MAKLSADGFAVVARHGRWVVTAHPGPEGKNVLSRTVRLLLRLPSGRYYLAQQVAAEPGRRAELIRVFIARAKLLAEAQEQKDA